MKYKVFLIFIFLFFGINENFVIFNLVESQESDRVRNLILTEAQDTTYKFRVVENRSFGEGEKLEFVINYGPINAGNASLEIIGLKEYNGRQCFHIVSTARSNAFFSVFFKVDDRVESLMDAEGLFTHRYEKHLREGKFKADNYVNFDQRKKLAIYENDTIPVPEYVQDVLTAMYYVRTLDLKVGRSVFVNNHTDRKNYPLELKVYKREVITVPAGKFRCLKVEPILKGPGIFLQRGKLEIWITDDAVKMPVLMKSKVSFLGAITAQLERFQLGKLYKG